MLKKFKAFFAGKRQRLGNVEDMEEQVGYIDELYTALNIARKCNFLVSFDIRIKGLHQGMIVCGDDPAVEWFMNYLAGMKQVKSAMIEQAKRARLTGKVKLL